MIPAVLTVFYDWITKKIYIERGDKCRLYELTNERVHRIAELLGDPSTNGNGIMYWSEFERSVGGRHD